MSERFEHVQAVSGTETGSVWDAEVGGVRVRFGAGRVAEAANVSAEIGCQRLFLVVDPAVEAAGHLQGLLVALERLELDSMLFRDVSENPTGSEVDAGCRVAASFAPDGFLAVGGGSTMDCAKGINFLLTNGGTMADYWGFGKVERPLLPAIGVPTTAGTGSEAQSYALISDTETHRKMACGDRSARFHTVILDPALVSTVPAPVAAAAGIDAIAHSIESFVSLRSNPISQLLSLRAWELLDANLETLVEASTPASAGGSLLGAHLAGAAIEQSMLGVAHACANPLTASFGIVHGQAIALMLPHVIRFNSEVADPAYRQLAETVGLPMTSSGGADLALRVEAIRHRLGLPEHLRDVGVERSDLEDLADSAATEWTARFNPRPVAEAELLSLYREAF